MCADTWGSSNAVSHVFTTKTRSGNLGQIGELLYLDSGTLTPLLKRLEKQGLISRRRRVQDDRTVENWLTQEGIALRERAGAIPGELVCNAELEVQQLQELKENLNTLLDKLLNFHDISQQSDD